MALKEAFVEIDGKPFKDLDQAFEAVRKAFHEAKKEDVAAQLEKAKGKGASLWTREPSVGNLTDGDSNKE